VAISHALTILGFGEMTDEQRPPEEIWLDDEALSDHFEGVKAAMKAGTSGGDMEPIDQQNEFTRGLRKG
jgi:hypothetical protein